MVMSFKMLNPVPISTINIMFLRKVKISLSLSLFLSAWRTYSLVFPVNLVLKATSFLGVENPWSCICCTQNCAKTQSHYGGKFTHKTAVWSSEFFSNWLHCNTARRIFTKSCASSPSRHKRPRITSQIPFTSACESVRRGARVNGE